MQLLDLTEKNEHVGYWSLLLSQLPFIYGHMTKEVLETVAKEIVKAVLSEGVVLNSGMVERDLQRVSVVDLVTTFLESEGFVELKVLQEHLLNGFCTNLSSNLRRR